MPGQVSRLRRVTGVVQVADDFTVRIKGSVCGDLGSGCVLGFYGCFAGVPQLPSMSRVSRALSRIASKLRLALDRPLGVDLLPVEPGIHLRGREMPMDAVVVGRIDREGAVVGIALIDRDVTRRVGERRGVRLGIEVAVQAQGVEGRPLGRVELGEGPQTWGVVAGAIDIEVARAGWVDEKLALVAPGGRQGTRGRSGERAERVVAEGIADRGEGCATGPRDIAVEVGREPAKRATRRGSRASSRRHPGGRRCSSPRPRGGWRSCSSRRRTGSSSSSRPSRWRSASSA